MTHIHFHVKVFILIRRYKDPHRFPFMVGVQQILSSRPASPCANTVIRVTMRSIRLYAIRVVKYIGPNSSQYGYFNE